MPLACLKNNTSGGINYYQGRHFDNVYPIEYSYIEKDIWLLVPFEVSHGKSKNYTKYYIGKVTNKTKEEIEGSFFRSRQTKLCGGFIYAFPEKPDICAFTYDQVVGQVVQVIENIPSFSTRELLRLPK